MSTHSPEGDTTDRTPGPTKMSVIAVPRILALEGPNPEQLRIFYSEVEHARILNPNIAYGAHMPNKIRQEIGLQKVVAHSTAKMLSTVT